MSDPQSTAAGRESRRFGALLFGASALLATLLRILYLLPLRGHPLFDEPHRDSIEYVNRAREILAGDFWGAGVYFHSAPLYPYFMALVMGPAGLLGLWWVRVAQALLSGLTVGFLALCAGRLFGRSAAVATAVMATLYAPFLFYAGELLEITLSMFFLSVAAWAMARETLSGPRLLGIGALIGAAALGKPNLLVLAPVLLIGIGFLRPIRRPASWPWRRGLLFVLGMLVVISPFTLRNRIVGGDWVLISSNGGINLFIGNNPTANGGFSVPTAMQYDLEESSRQVAAQAEGRDVKPSEVSRFWAGRAWAFFTQRPAEAGKLFLRKLGLLVGHYEIPNHFDIYFFRDYLAPMLRWPLVWYTLVLPLAIVGLVFGARRSRPTRIAAACLLAVAASVVLFFVTSRYRLPMLIWLLPFAGAGLVGMVGLLRQKRWRLLLLPVVLFVASIFLMRLPLVGVTDYHGSWTTIASFWGRQGDWDKAAHYNTQALRENDRSATAWHNLGHAYTQRGEDLDMDRAEECFFKTLTLDPTHAHAYGNLAYVYFRWNRPELFDLCLDRALALDPGVAEGLGELIRFRQAKTAGWRERAELQLADIEGRLEEKPDDARLIHERGRIMGLRLEEHYEALAVLSTIPPATLSGDSLLAARQQMVIDRINRSINYGHLLHSPLPAPFRTPSR